MQYTPLGEYIVRTALTMRMTERLKMVDYIKKHPEVNNVPIQRPIIIIGFTRTGTTFLHELLGLHPNVKMPYTWQIMEPVPTPGVETFDGLEADLKKRFKNNRRRFETMLAVSGSAIQRIHRIAYDEPEECTVPCGFELPWNITELPWCVGFLCTRGNLILLLL